MESCHPITFILGGKLPGTCLLDAYISYKSNSGTRLIESLIIVRKTRSDRDCLPQVPGLWGAC